MGRELGVLLFQWLAPEIRLGGERVREREREGDRKTDRERAGGR